MNSCLKSKYENDVDRLFKCFMMNLLVGYVGAHCFFYTFMIPLQTIVNSNGNISITNTISNIIFVKRFYVAPLQ